MSTNIFHSVGFPQASFLIYVLKTTHGKSSMKMLSQWKLLVAPKTLFPRWKTKIEWIKWVNIKKKKSRLIIDRIQKARKDRGKAHDDLKLEVGEKKNPTTERLRWISCTSLHTHWGFCTVLSCKPAAPRSHLPTLPHPCKLITTKVRRKVRGSDEAKGVEGWEQGDQWDLLL